MKYLVSYTSPNLQYIDFEYIIDNVTSANLQIQLPAWRPGRYELGNFAKNIQKWDAFTKNGNKLPSQKIKKDLWEVETQGESTIHIKYNYYAAELNAGSTWLDSEQIYINPVNCCLYIPDRIAEPCELELKVPVNYQIATSLKVEKEWESDMEKRILLAAIDYHELADSPFIASAELEHNMFVYEGIEFHLWFQGMKNPPWSKILSDFFVFVNEQFLTFGDFPVKEYHFIFQILPYKAYHGVEHQNSTVIALGPKHAVIDGYLYNEFLGVSSHELFHTWNVKYIRPIDMMPYNYAVENYSKLGYVAEGLTTYYGDLMLFRSGVFKEKDFFEVFGEQFQKHFDNFGRLNLSVAHSSFDTWLDGYVPGVPNRKSSIYTEGCLLAFIKDVLIRKYTDNKQSLDDVLRALYNLYGKQGRGYSEENYRELIENTAKVDFKDFFEKYIHGVHSIELLLEDALNYLGLMLEKSPSPMFNEAFLGFKMTDDGGKISVKNIYPGSPAAENLMINDVIIGINGIKIHSDLNNWCKYFNALPDKLLQFSIISNGKQKEVELTISKEIFYRKYSINRMENPSLEQINAYNNWAKGLKLE